MNIDPSGLLVPYAHAWVVRRAAREAGCNSNYGNELAELVAGVDSLPGSQEPQNSEAHHMADGSINQSQADALIDYNNYIGEIENALNTGTDSVRRSQALALYIHAEQDGLSRGHENFQQWNGLQFSDTLELIAHGWRDFFVGQDRTDELVARTRELINEYGGCECEG